MTFRCGIAQAAIVLLALAGCASQSQPPFLSTFDESSGQSLSFAREPLVFAAPRPGYSQVGKDYLIVSPLRANIDGSNETYLWFTVGSTIDRVLTGIPAADIREVVVRADGQIMRFETTAWMDRAAQRQLGLKMQREASFVARVTRSELAAFARADRLSAWVLDGERRSPSFVLRQGSSGDWAGF